MALRRWHWSVSHGTVAISAAISGGKKRVLGVQCSGRGTRSKALRPKFVWSLEQKWESGGLECEDSNKNPRALGTLEGSVDFILTAREILRNVHKGVMSFRNHLAYIWRSGIEEKGEGEVVFFFRSCLTVKSKPKVLQNRKFFFFFPKKALCLNSYRFLNILKERRTP